MHVPEFMPYIWINNFGDEDVANFYRHFYALESFSDSAEIIVFINSFGGEFHNFMAMRSLIKQASKPVCTVTVGKAMSCGALLAMSGSKGYRFAAPEAQFMVHEVSLAEVQGKTTDMIATTDSLKFLNKQMLNFLGEDTKLDQEEWVDIIKGNGNADLYFGAKQAKKYGMVDHIGLPSFNFLPSLTHISFNPKGKS